MPGTIFNCCRQCQVFFSCQAKWCRGEKGESNSCCEKCINFAVCQRISSRIQALAGRQIKA